MAADCSAVAKCGTNSARQATDTPVIQALYQALQISVPLGKCI